MVPLHRLIDPRIEGLFIHCLGHRLARIQHLHVQHFTAIQHLHPLIGIHHHRDRLAAQGIPWAASRLQKVALALKRHHQVFGQLALRVKGADPRQRDLIAVPGTVGIPAITRRDAKPGIVRGMYSARNALGSVINYGNG